MKPIEELTFTDDFMFGHIMQNKEICTELLECLLNIKIDHVEYPELQKSLSAFYETKGVRLDVYVKDSDRVFDIEIQNNPELNLAKRTRYYQSMLDIDNLLKGEDYDTLKESYIIFICTFDPFGKNLSTYTFRNLCIEKANLELDDKTTKIIFNAEAFEKEKDVAISAFLRYISKRIPTDSFTEKLDSLVEKSKDNQKLRSEYLAMNLHDRDIKKQAYKDGLEEGISKGISQGISQGAEQAKLETARNLFSFNLSLEQIMQATGLPLETVEQLSKEIK